MRALNKDEIKELLDMTEDCIESRTDAVFEHQRMWGEPAIPTRHAQRVQLLNSTDKALGIKILLKALLDGDKHGH